MKIHVLWRIGLVLFALALLPVRSMAHDWTSWRGPEQNGVSREVDLPAKFSLDASDPNSNLIWHAPYGIRSTPIVMNGRVYINNQVGEKINEQERVMCLDADTGKVLWEKRFNVWHTDIVSVRLGWGNLAGDPKTGNIYWHGTQGLFICFDKDGKILWERSLTEEFGRISGYGGRLTSPTVDEDLVIIGMLSYSYGSQAKGAVRYLAMNKDKGDIIWWWESKEKPLDTYYSNPVIAVIGGQRLLITGGGDGFLHAIKVRSGEHVWSYPLCKGGINSSPVVDGNLVYICHGTENLDSNIQGGVFCFDGSQVENGQPKLVWKEYGIGVSYTSPVLHDGKLYVCTDIARMHCLDAKTGKALWRRPLAYGRNAKGSPVWADGKIYVAPVNSAFCIIEPGDKKGEILHEQEFPSPDGIIAVELNGTPAVANGRVYFGTSEGLYCIGKKDHSGKAGAIPAMPEESPAGKPASIRIEPAEVTLAPGEKVQFTVRVLDANGHVLDIKDEGEWSIPTPPTPPTPPTLKVKPPVLQGTISASGELTVDSKVNGQDGIVQFKGKYGTAVARICVPPTLPYSENFDGVENGLVPGAWINTQGKFTVGTLKDGSKVLKGNNKVGSPLVARANAYFGSPNLTNYTIEADMYGTKVDSDLPDMGVVANRYRLVLFGNLQRLRIDSWDAMPRVAVAVPFEIKPNTWYRLKFKVQVDEAQKKAYLYGKAWQRGQQEPMDWLVTFVDPNPNFTGSPALYRYATGILDDRPGTEVYFDNVEVRPNDKQ